MEELHYGCYGVIVSITNGNGNVTRFEFADMWKATKFIKQYHNNTTDTIRDIELHEIALPN